ncbi:hypothetical protein HYU95_01440, partial [Candidatus Daviesbacteria bacterium]|nr:hypothetical protein [Candidatus Daviesbacteria bacterium]
MKNNLTLKQKFLAILVVSIILISIILLVNSRKPKPSVSPTNNPQSTQISPTDKPQIISTKPDPLDENIVSGAEAIEITFNRPLENVGEFKSRIEPEIEYKVE